MAATAHRAGLDTGRRVFCRVLVGVDGSAQALEAARQAALLQDVDGRLTLLAAADVASASARAERDLREAADRVAPYAAAVARVVRGAPVAALLEEIERDDDTLVAVGGSDRARPGGIADGPVATAILRRAPCSVLVARPSDEEVPRRIVVGVDGSAATRAAARYLAERFCTDLCAVVAGGAVDALVKASREADLLVLGSRGVGVFGPVPERVALRASCSTLVVHDRELRPTHLPAAERRRQSSKGA